MTAPVEIADLEAMLEEEVPCGGIGPGLPVSRSCNKAAIFARDFCHNCPVETSNSSNALKCAECWQVWYIYHSGIIARGNWIQCVHCRSAFSSVGAFSSYRPF